MNIIAALKQRLAQINKMGIYGVTLTTALPDLSNYSGIVSLTLGELEEKGIWCLVSPGRVSEEPIRYYYLNREDRDADIELFIPASLKDQLADV